MARFIQVGDEIFDLDSISYAAIANGRQDHVTEIRLVLGTHAVDIHSYGNVPRLTAVWNQIVETLKPERWEAPQPKK
jgi:hypothetical protein